MFWRGTSAPPSGSAPPRPCPERCGCSSSPAPRRCHAPHQSPSLHLPMQCLFSCCQILPHRTVEDIFFSRIIRGHSRCICWIVFFVVAFKKKLLNLFVFFILIFD